MVSWRAKTGRAIGLALAPATQKTYQRAVDRFMFFRVKFGYPRETPPSVEQLIYYCVFVKAQGLSVKSIRG